MYPDNADHVLYDWGPQFLAKDTVRFRIWAPDHLSMTLGLDDRSLRMQRSGGGWFEVVASEVKGDSNYHFILPDGTAVPDPAARMQRDDVHGHSVVVDPDKYIWDNPNWVGRPWEEAVIYELHVGTFTLEGTFDAIVPKLDHLLEIGITAIELMPLAQFPGDRGWGYDGTLHYAPHNAYGTPDQLKALIDAAHGRGLMVFLDVVYNHFGPDGNYLNAYASPFFDPGRHTPWGAAIDFAQIPVRSFFVDNALYWLKEFKFDGLRFDAIDHLIDDNSDVEILVELAQRIRAAFTQRKIHLITEDNRNITRLHQREDGDSVLYTAEWNDDFHSVAHVIATGETDGHFQDFSDNKWGKFARALAEGFVYQGEKSPNLSGRRRGEPSAGLPPFAFVDFLQNHDQIGNRAFGERMSVLADPNLLRVLSAILMLSPHIPLLFMGEEWGATRPFYFFTDFSGPLADAVREGRRKEFGKFAGFADGATETDPVPDPNDLEIFQGSKIDWEANQTPEGKSWHAFFRETISLRRRHVMPFLSGAHGNAGHVRQCDDGIIAVDWTLNGSSLSLGANLSCDAKQLETLPPAPFFSYPPGCASPETGSVLPPFSVVVGTRSMKM
jgi:maltooligosyltrehalose trehalohydrolase